MRYTCPVCAEVEVITNPLDLTSATFAIFHRHAGVLYELMPTRGLKGGTLVCGLTKKVLNLDLDLDRNEIPGIPI